MQRLAGVGRRIKQREGAMIPWAAALALAILLPATEAGAAIVTATYTGTVVSGFDTAGLFGPKGQDLAGAAYTAVYTTDTVVPNSVSLEDPNNSGIAGGREFRPGTTSPSSAKITIRGKSLYISGRTMGLVALSRMPHAYIDQINDVRDWKQDRIYLLSNWLVIQSLLHCDPGHYYNSLDYYPLTGVDDGGGLLRIIDRVSSEEIVEANLVATQVTYAGLSKPVC